MHSTCVSLACGFVALFSYAWSFGTGVSGTLSEWETLVHSTCVFPPAFLLFHIWSIRHGCANVQGLAWRGMHLAAYQARNGLIAARNQTQPEWQWANWAHGPHTKKMSIFLFFSIFIPSLPDPDLPSLCPIPSRFFLFHSFLLKPKDTELLTHGTTSILLIYYPPRACMVGYW